MTRHMPQKCALCSCLNSLNQCWSSACDHDSLSGSNNMQMITSASFRALVALALFGLWTSHAAGATGEEVYAKRCASCHDQTNSRIPSRDSLQKMPAARILKVLDFGVMMQIAYPLNREEREAVAKFLGTEGPESTLQPDA